MISPTSSYTIDKLRQELQEVDWSRFETAYGIATNVPGSFDRLFSADQADAMEASHELWCGLCHQHTFLSTAALPALPFLFRALDALDEELASEVLDIIYGLVVCTSRDALPAWEQSLRQVLLRESSRFDALTKHQNEDIAGWADMICEALDVAPT